MADWRVMDQVAGATAEFTAEMALYSERIAKGASTANDRHFVDKGEAEAFLGLLQRSAERYGYGGAVTIHLCSHADGGPGTGSCLDAQYAVVTI